MVGFLPNSSITNMMFFSVHNFSRLSEIKSNQKLQGISLIKQSRLSVMPIIKEHWDIILEMGETSI